MELNAGEVPGDRKDIGVLPMTRHINPEYRLSLYYTAAPTVAPMVNQR